MARVTRTRVVQAPVGEVWGLIADPYNLPRWWPRTKRVENVAGSGGRTRWTQVLETAEGRGVRADFRCLGSAERERYAWGQEVEGTPFARHLRASKLEIALRERDGGTEVTLSAQQTLKGLSRLGSPLMRRGQGETLAEALDGIEVCCEGGQIGDERNTDSA